MNEELKIIIKAVTDSAQKAIKEVKGELEGMSKTAKSASGKIGAVFKGIAKGAAIVVGAITAVIGAIVALGKNTLDTQKQFAKLNTAFQSAGMSARQAGETYNQLFRFLGESDRAVEAAGHLAKITTNQQNLAEWTKIAQGVYATFGDSLPIEGLTEAANETLRVGQVTGTLADALNWAGVSEDEFNTKLAQTGSLEEREALLRSTLNGLYSEAADIYERNNGALLAYNESQARLDTTMSQAGAATLPLLTALNDLGSAFFSALKPALDKIIPPLTTFINWITKAIQTVTSFFSALTGKSTTIKAIGDIGGAAAGAAKSLGGAAQGAKNLGSGMKGAEKAADGAAKAAEEAKKSTQGFDELNIVSSGKTSSSSSGSDSGGSSSSPGYTSGGGGSGLIDTATFGTEVEETESTASSFADRLKDIFGGLKDDLAPSIEAWSEAFDTVKEAWNNAKPDFINGVQNIKDGFSTLGSYLIDDFVPNVVNSFSTNLAPVFGELAGFSLEETGKWFSWFGEKFKTEVDDVYIPIAERMETVLTDTFDAIGKGWEKHGGGFLDKLSEAFESIRKTADNFYDNVFKPIWDKVLEVFDKVWQEGLKPLVENFVESALSIGEELLILYNEVIAPVVDWIIENILPIIVGVIEKIIEIVGDLFIDISKIVSDVIDIIEGIVKFVVGVFTGDWEKAWEGIKDIFSGVWDLIKNIVKLAWDAIKLILEPVGEFFKGIWEGICNIFKDVKEWFKQRFDDAWNAIKGIWEKVSDWFKTNVWDKIVGIFNGVKDWFKQRFDDAWMAIKGIWETVSNWFKTNVWDKITDTFGDVKGWFKQKFSDAWSAIKDVFSNWGSFFSGLWDDIKTTFSSLGSNLGSAIGDAVKSGINGVISLIESTLNKGINLINGAIGLINKLPGVSVGRISKLSLPRLAKGGIVDSATVAMIGEAGKEAVVPLENNTEWMDRLADRLAAKTAAPSKIVLTLDGKELGWANIHAINDITKQTGNLPLVIA